MQRYAVPPLTQWYLATGPLDTLILVTNTRKYASMQLSTTKQVDRYSLCIYLVGRRESQLDYIVCVRLLIVR